MSTQPSPDPWQPWRAAQSFAELTALAARFLEGELERFPGWMYDDIDEETDALVPALCAACEGGLLPTASQPGACPELSHDGLPWKQRAFVIGFASPEFASGWAERSAGTRLEWRSFAANESGGPEILAAAQGPREYLWIGGAKGSDELEIFAEHLSSAAQAELEACRYLVCWDPEWGQDDLLWPILAGS